MFKNNMGCNRSMFLGGWEIYGLNMKCLPAENVSSSSCLFIYSHGTGSCSNLNCSSASSVDLVVQHRDCHY